MIEKSFPFLINWLDPSIANNCYSIRNARGEVLANSFSDADDFNPPSLADLLFLSIQSFGGIVLFVNEEDFFKGLYQTLVNPKAAAS